MTTLRTSPLETFRSGLMLRVDGGYAFRGNAADTAVVREAGLVTDTFAAVRGADDTYGRVLTPAGEQLAAQMKE